MIALRQASLSHQHRKVVTQVKDIMTASPACCTADAGVQDAALLMVKHDCGEIPVIESEENPKPIGVITDRDIACRVVAAGRDLRETSARDCMSTPCVTVSLDATVEQCCGVLEENQIRRVPVVDESGNCCGIVAQADIARHASEQQAAQVLQEISHPNQHPSRVEERSG